MSGFPRRPPIEIRESKFVSMRSILVISILAIIVASIALVVVVWLWLFQDRQETGVTPTPQAASAPEPTVIPTATPAPVVQILPLQTYQFTEPIKLNLKVQNIDPQELTVELLDRNGKTLPGGSGASSPNSTTASSSDDNDLLVLEGNTITIRAERLVGQFAVRVKLKDQVLAVQQIEVQPPVLPSLAELLDIQPPLKLEDKYILLPNESTISLSDKSRPWRLELETNQDGFSRDREDTTIKLTVNQVSSTLALRIKMTDVYSETGEVFVHPVELPLVAFSPYSGGQAGEQTGGQVPLTAYNVEGCREEDNSPTLIDNITDINSGVFRVSNVCQNNNKNNDRLVMLIAKVTDPNKLPDKDGSSPIQTFQFKEVGNTLEVEFGGLKKTIPSSSKLVNESIFYVYRKDDTPIIVMFGLLPQSQTQ